MRDEVLITAINRHRRLALTDDGAALEITDFLDAQGLPVEVDVAEIMLVRTLDGRWTYALGSEFEPTSTN